ncbi:MAG: diaminopimelate epimerase, partial [Verrucomicrobia bacterium]|nr:diaminopimelate epimerase [Verrucomicrobiota bacterium]
MSIGMRYAKYHALGNDYVVIPLIEATRDIDRRTVELICHRNYGV